MPHPNAARPVPILTPEVLPTVARASIPVDSQDARGGEKLVDVRALGVRGHNFYARPDSSNALYDRPIQGAIPGLLLRESAAKLVAQVDQALRPHGLGLYVLDGYRPIATQVGLWQHFRDYFACKTPQLTEAEIERETKKFVSDPRGFDRTDARTWPLHATGGAVDLTLCDASGELLDLGTPFDDPSDKAATAYFEIWLAQGEIGDDDPRLLSRRILYWSMRDAGFTNYLYEWWHFDWGNQMYILSLGLLGQHTSSPAWYGYIEPTSA
ncbi:MAG: hypothetical protein E6G97_15465 [Alphaproteobacteria bacterium]|nr:MAG: hypothetical protein E6G97_15465 [Alphaproteobacteria bacterium]